MAQVNICLKRTFTIFNIFFAIIGVVILGLALLLRVLTNGNGGEHLVGSSLGLIVLYVVGSVTIVIAILGVYGVDKESKECLIAFLVCMIIGCLLMLRAGIPIASTRPELEGLVKELEVNFRKLLPLDKASYDVRETVEGMQRQLHCCGLFSHDDWEGNIPDSCVCDQMEGECQMLDYSMMMIPLSKSIYTKSCFPIIHDYIMFITDIMIGVFFTLAILALLGMVLSSVIIHQMHYAIFTQLPKYQELNNPPEY